MKDTRMTNITHLTTFRKKKTRQIEPPGGRNSLSFLLASSHMAFSGDIGDKITTIGEDEVGEIREDGE